MVTYQDFLQVGDSDKERMEFVRSVINQHKETDLYKNAVIADEYYRNMNTTIVNYEKTLVTATGRIVADEWSPNHKTASGFFRRFVNQQNQYLLGNGARWNEESTEKKLGKKFDSALKKLGKYALINGVAFGYWNLDRLQVFKVTEFAPLLDEENGSIRAGVRFWQIDASKPLRATLYEEDGYTDYIWNTRENGSGQVLHDKSRYITVKRISQAEGEEIMEGRNYPSFPIIPLWANDEKVSELIPIRDGIDAYDMIKNGFENDLDTAQLYWIIQGAGGMDNQDLIQFIDRLYKQKIASIDGDQNISATTVDIPYAAREALLDRIEKDLYRDYQALNTDEIKSGSVVTAQIKAAYEAMNTKADDYEYMVHDFLDSLLEIIGINDEATFTRSMLVNSSEIVTMVLQAADHLSSDYVTQKILDVLGDGDKYEEVLKQMDEESAERLSEPEEPIEEEDDEGTEQPVVERPDEML